MGGGGSVRKKDGDAFNDVDNGMVLAQHSYNCHGMEVTGELIGKDVFVLRRLNEDLARNAKRWIANAESAPVSPKDQLVWRRTRQR